MPEQLLAQRLRRLSVATVLGHEVRVARGPRARFLGLAHLDRERAGSGLLIPRCSSIHTFGMRFELDVYFLDAEGRVLSVRRRVPPWRVLWQPGAAAVLEIPSPQGGESASPGT